VRRIITLFILSSSFFISFAKAGFQNFTGTDFNWFAIWLSFCFGLLFTILFRFLNRHSKTIDLRSNAGQPFSGWIIFLGFNLILRIIVQIYFFWDANYYLEATWLYLYETGGTGLQALFIFELFLSLFAITGTGALIYWYWGKRDIFPAMFIYYVGFYLIATMVLFIIYRNINLPADMISIRRNGIFQISRIIYAATWIIYILKSEQVKQTFVYPPN